MEFKVTNKSDSHGSIVEVCIDDQWYEATRSTLVANNSQSQDISIRADSTSMMIIWSGQSIPNDKIISGYDLSCTTSISALFDGQIHEVKVLNISASTTRVQVDGLLPGTAYECCVNAHILTNTPLDLISSSCVATITEIDKIPSCHMYSDDLATGIGSGLGLLLVVVCMGSISINIFLMVRLKRGQGTTMKFSSTNR